MYKKQLMASASGKDAPNMIRIDSLGEPVADATIYVLYTGGTIGMKLDNGVYMPRQNFLFEELWCSSVFNDQSYAKLVEKRDTNTPLVLPPTKAGCRIKYFLHEYIPLLDSSDMSIKQWNLIAEDIFDNYSKYDGFVVLHGTDTMAYTASALSFMCENLGKPIILTGSQIPIFEIRSDGRDNFLTSLVLAGTHCIPEVMIYFNDKLFRGNRCIKADNSSLSAFDSPNMSPLATVNISINVDWPAVFRSGTTERFHIHKNLCPNVGVLRLFPSITVQTVKAFLQPPMQGVVLQTYGAGNAPSQRKELIEIFHEAYHWGVIIVNVTQCERGSVFESYETGKVLLDAGVIPGGDMTTEAALCKLSYVLGKDDWVIETKRKMMGRNLRGEMEVLRQASSSVQDFELLESIARTMSISTKEEIKHLRDTLYPLLMCSAAKLGSVQTLEKLRQSGVNISASDYDGRTPLHVAAGAGNLQAVQYLLQHGASVHIRDNRSHKPLYDAIRAKSTNVVKLLVQTGATSSCVAEDEIGTELCLAAAENDVQTLSLWQEAGVNLNSPDYTGSTALHVAVTNKCKEVVEYLLPYYADRTAIDNHQKTAHDIAVLLGNDEITNIFTSYLSNN